ncbi:MAG: hypothetical protein ACLQMF_10165 [Rectinemataceae bacterium]
MKQPRMVRAAASLLLMICAIVPLAAQSAPAQQPQIAYRILDDFEKTQAVREAVRRKDIGIVFTIGGGLIVGGSVAVLGAGNQLFPVANGNDPKVAFSAAWGTVGLLLLGDGIWMLATPPVDYHKRYDLVFSETDPVVQEALAAATLKGIADQGRNKRITRGMLGIAIPLLACLAVGISDSASSRGWSNSFQNPAFDIGMAAIFSAGGVKFFERSPEEEVYEKYLAAREALYSTPRSGE